MSDFMPKTETQFTKTTILQSLRKLQSQLWDEFDVQYERHLNIEPDRQSAHLVQLQKLATAIAILTTVSGLLSTQGSLSNGQMTESRKQRQL